MIKRLEVLVKGRVQMVMFRDYVKRGARRLGLSGFVKNNPDGTVTAIAEGEEELLNQLVIRIKKGSLLSRVDSVDERWLQPNGEFKGFNILYN